MGGGIVIWKIASYMFLPSNRLRKRVSFINFIHVLKTA